MAGVGRTSTPCWCCAMRCAIDSGSKLGRPWGAHRLALRTKLRQAKSHQRREPACWFLVVWGVRLPRLSHPSGAPAHGYDG